MAFPASVVLGRPVKVEDTNCNSSLLSCKFLSNFFAILLCQETLKMQWYNSEIRDNFGVLKKCCRKEGHYFSTSLNKFSSNRSVIRKRLGRVFVGMDASYKALQHTQYFVDLEQQIQWKSGRKGNTNTSVFVTLSWLVLWVKSMNLIYRLFNYQCHTSNTRLLNHDKHQHPSEQISENGWKSWFMKLSLSTFR